MTKNRDSNPPLINQMILMKNLMFKVKVKRCRSLIQQILNQFVSILTKNMSKHKQSIVMNQFKQIIKILRILNMKMNSLKIQALVYNLLKKPRWNRKLQIMINALLQERVSWNEKIHQVQVALH